MGSIPALLRNAPRTLLRGAQRYPGAVFAVRLGPVTVPVVSEPEHLEEVLITRAHDFTRSGMWESTRPLLGYGLVTSDGSYWRRQRRLMQPLFGPKHLNGLVDVMVEAISGQLDLMAERSRRGALDVSEEMTGITQRVLMTAFFGAAFSPERATELGRHLMTAFKAMSFRIPLYFLPEWFPRPKQAAFFRSIAAIDAALSELLDKRRRRPTDAVDILNCLIAAQDADTGERMTDAQIRDELITLFVAGLDTTAVTLTWLLWLLSMHPDIMASLCAEIEQVIGARPPAVDDLGRLPRTRRVIQETMRLYPPVWMFPRYAPKGTLVGGVDVAPGTSLVVSPYLTHRNPRLWERPDSFDPDRFSEPRSAGRPKLAFLPFGGGSRQCLGTHFGMMEAQLATAALLQRFAPRLPPGQRIEPVSASTLHPRRGIMMLFEPRAIG